MNIFDIINVACNKNKSEILKKITKLLVKIELNIKSILLN